MDLSIMVGEVKFNYRAGLLIKRGNKILVEVNPDIDFVTIPGGRIKTLENSQEGLLREIQEEMNIDLSKDDLKVKALIENFFHMDGKDFHELFVLYKIKVKEEDARFQDDMINHDSKASYYRWVDQDKLGDENLLPEPVRYIEDNDQFEHIVVNNLVQKKNTH